MKYPHCIIINLATRPDRRELMAEVLAGAGWPADRIVWLPGIDPRTSGSFLSPGIRGCHLSHIAALNYAQNRGWDPAMILEDDCVFRPGFVAVMEMALARDDWSICYLGHVREELVSEKPLWVCAPDERFRQAHCYLVRSRELRPLCEYLEGQHLRTEEDPLGGPMHLDAGLNWYRRLHSVPTLVATPPVAVQRSSRSDITPRVWDRVPVLRQLAGLARRFRSTPAVGRFPASA
jgi:glycosyl transferase family 25